MFRHSSIFTRHFLLCVLCASVVKTTAAEPAKPKSFITETFTQELSKDWFWGLGTWTARNGILRGFESGPRRHGPVKMRRFALLDGTLECEFRLEGRASFAGIIFNGSQERGHIVHLVVGKDKVRILAHPQPKQTTGLLSEANELKIGDWHRVKLEFRGPQMIATLNGKTFTATNPCIAEEKLVFGLGGDSGGPEGEKAGALEFRNLVITQPQKPN